MATRYLEVTFRNGKPLAAYLYLPRPAGSKAVRTVAASPGVLVDYSSEGTPIGIEITAPSAVEVQQINQVLRSLGLEDARPDEFAPLKAA
jgi:uncharacterized protein YuzE